MRTVFTWTARILAVLFSILFVFTLFAALILVSAENRLFRSATYKSAFESTNLYQRMPKLLAEQIITNLATNPCEKNPLLCLPDEAVELRACLERDLGQEAYTQIINGQVNPSEDQLVVIQACADQFGQLPQTPDQQTPSYFKYLTVQDWEILIGTLVPPEQMKAVTEQTLDDLFAFFDGEINEVNVSLVPIKDNLAHNGVEATKRILAAQPDCTTEQLLTLTSDLALGLSMGEKILCNPPQELTAAFAPLIEASVQSEIETIPNTIPVVRADSVQRDTINLGRSLIRLMLLLPLAFLILITLLVVRTLKDWLGWWGVPLTLTGILAVLTALVSAPLTQFTLTSDMIASSSVYALRFAQAGSDVILALVRQVMLPVGILGALLLVIGVGMLIGRRFVPQESNQGI